MKKIPLTVKIPCFIDLIVSGFLILSVFVFIGAGRPLSFAELILLIFLALNAVSAYKCLKGNSLFRYITVGLKVILSFYIPLFLLVVILWGYLLIFNASVRDFFRQQ